jgi:hypothetical protein
MTKTGVLKSPVTVPLKDNVNGRHILWYQPLKVTYFERAEIVSKVLVLKILLLTAGASRENFF